MLKFIQNLSTLPLGEELKTEPYKGRTMNGSKLSHAAMTYPEILRTDDSGPKPRELLYPVGRLRTVNEKLNFHLRKIKLPEYVMSPRKGYGQRENADAHLNGTQVLRLDLRKFYPSITRERIARYFREEFGMYVDVAGLITELLTSDGRILYGAPATPVLATLVHIRMFDEINTACKRHNATMTLWVDNFTISSQEVKGELIEEIRGIIAKHGHRSHEINIRQTNRTVGVTGIGVKRGSLNPPNSSNLTIKKMESDLHNELDIDNYEVSANALLSRLGSQRHIVGAKSLRGQKIANRMHAIRQKRDAIRIRAMSG